MSRYYRKKKGSVTLEAAIAFTITIVFITGMVSFSVFMRSDILMQRAVTATCRKLSLMTPLSTPVTDVLSTAVNAMPDMPLAEGASDVAVALETADELTGNGLTDLVLDGLLSRRIENDIASNYVQMGGSEFFMPRKIDVDIQTDTGRSVIAVYVRYETVTILGPVTRNICDVVPFYGDIDLFLNPQEQQEEESEGSNVWDLENFARGEYLAEEYGCNLPSTFPVINSFEDGTARGVTSIDLTSPWYRRSRVESRIRSEIDDLAGFDGAHWAVDGRSYDIRQGSVRSRVLQVIIPENSPDEYVSIIEEYNSYAQSRGVDMEIISQGVSRRYTDDNDDEG